MPASLTITHAVTLRQQELMHRNGSIMLAVPWAFTDKQIRPLTAQQCPLTAQQWFPNHNQSKKFGGYKRSGAPHFEVTS